jgi:hypothetical protein
MPSSRRERPKGKSSAKPSPRARPPAKKSRPPAPKPAKSARPVASKTAAKPAPKAPSKAPAKPKEAQPELEVPLPDGRKHLLSLSFVRDGDEFMARLETDAGHITELKNRSLDQLLTLVASELEDLLE